MSEEKADVGTIILAAGAASRMGQPKQLLPFKGRSLLRRMTDAALASKSQTIVVVVGANAERVRQDIENLPVLIALNDHWHQGMGTSVRAGLEALERADGEGKLGAAVLMPCDQPHLGPETLNRLIDAHRVTGKPIVVSGYSDIWGTPMLFARSLWPELQELDAKRGAQSVALRHAEAVECVPFPLGAFDLDTRDDYERLLANTELASVEDRRENQA
ncbi:molybdenum cofactor cytidylyltransferase [Abditibacterium utsteinense]|uniref:Molybdenum cofactor cytidylyltransferase n=1 Tax=Abditibacterium utsteinense TaxID=1960156 RepID=A0A2S8SQ58_9BACT|nr:nucleotidyltransferase family protein [Abditibacterium utsteinense]PQV62928.1 molybdenum cofactor cytidylyltransferase [Abditibacterium utsteinense]